MLFQPSNITPSTLSGTGVIAVADNANITWQVNGNSQMTAFQVDIYQDNAQSTLVHSTGKLTTNCPFSGKDSKGNYIQFVYEPSATWNSWGLSDGNNYKLKITQYYNDGTEQSITQYSESAFISRTAPTFAITTPTVNTVAYTFTANYSQAQNDTVKWIAWTLTDNSGNILDNTGRIDTYQLSYTYNGFMNGQTYTISATLETASGVIAESSETFSVSYTVDTSIGSIRLQNTDDNAVLLSWAEATDIQGTATGSYSIADGVLSLDTGTVDWNTVNGNAMNLQAPYTTIWKGENKKALGTPVNANIGTRVLRIKFSENGTIAAVYAYGGGAFGNALYSNSNGTFTKLFSYPTSGRGFCVNPSGTRFLCVVGNSIRYSTISGTTVTYVTSISRTDLNYAEIEFIDDNRFIVIPGYGEKATVYTISGNTISAGTENTIIYTSSAPRCVADWNNTGYLFIYEVNQANYYNPYGVALYSCVGETLTLEYNITPLRQGVDFWVSYDKTSGNLAIAEISNAKSYVDIYSFDLSDTNYGLYAPETSIPVSGKLSSLSYNDSRIGVTYINGTQSYYNVYEYKENVITQVYAIGGYDYLYEVNWIIPEQSILLYGGTNTGQSIYELSIDTTDNSLVELNSESFIIKNGFDIIVYYWLGGGGGGTEKEFVTCPVSDNADTFIVSVSPETVSVYGFDSNNNMIQAKNYHIEADLEIINSVSLVSEQVCDYLFITQNADYDITQNDFTPAYDNNTLFFADFVEDLQAGTLSNTGNVSNVIYRLNNNQLLPIATVPTATTQLKDYGIVSRQLYSYELFYLNNGVYSSSVVSDGDICRQLKNYTLLEAVQDNDYPNTYHVINVWIFGNNIEASGISNGNNPTLQENFTKYPYRQISSQAPKSGTLQALLSNVKNGEYADTAEQMERLFEISQSTNDFFLKDMKGNIYQVHTSAPITQTNNTKTAYLETTVSIPWIEVGSTEDISIIQLPTDEGWDNTNTQTGGVIKYQSKTVPLNMSNGDQTITPDTDHLLTSVTVTRPNTLQPSTIKKGVNIGGIIGTYEPRLQTKVVTPTYQSQTISADTGYDGLNYVTVNAIPAAEKKDVNFYDYDGTLLYSYTLDEARQLTSLPQPPTHSDLTFVGWNWNLSSIQSLTHRANIGALYTALNNATKFYITLTDNNYTVNQYFTSFDTDLSLTIDWGDGMQTIVTGDGSQNPKHTYSASGNYVITYNITNGLISLGDFIDNNNIFTPNPQLPQNYAKSAILKKAIIGANVETNIGLRYCPSLQSLILTEGTTFSFDTSVIQGCDILHHINIPFEANGISLADGSLTSIAFPYNIQAIDYGSYSNCNFAELMLPDNITGIASFAFSDNNNLTELYLATSLTGIYSSAFANCYSLTRIVFPNSLELIGEECFANCYGMKTYDFTQLTSIPVLEDSNAFEGTFANIVVPDDLYGTWINATNWSNLAGYIVKESEQ